MLDFPSTGLVVGQRFPDPPIVGAPTWIWMGTRWDLISNDTFLVSPIAPPDPIRNFLWFNSTNARLYVWFDDGTSQQWIDISGADGPPGARGMQGLQGIQGIQGIQGERGLTGEVEEAPTGGLVWGRKDEDWIEVTEEAPEDGGLYLRSNGAWQRVYPTEQTLHVRKTTNQAITAGTWTTLAYNIVDIDTQAGWNSAINEYTPKVVGWYQFQCTTASQTNYIVVTKGTPAQAWGAHVNQIYADGQGTALWFRSGNCITFMNGTTDTLRVWVHCAAAQTQTPGTANVFASAFRLIGP